MRSADRTFRTVRFVARAPSKRKPGGTASIATPPGERNHVPCLGIFRTKFGGVLVTENEVDGQTIFQQTFTFCQWEFVSNAQLGVAAWLELTTHSLRD